ncbi:glycosyltransferase [Paracoccus sp. 12-3]|nr:glycosyltransferase [Paracoccus xiamenensis]
MPAWNAEDTIEMAARSILAQTWQRLELLIVDDASTDGTWAVLQRLAAEDPRVRVFRSEVNGGPYLCKNIALTQSLGAWITGHDADDWAHPERIERQVRYCLDNNTPACMSGMLRISGDGRLVRFNPIGGNVIDGALRNAFISLMVDAQVMHGALGHWDEARVGADSELLHRLQHIRGRDVPTVPKVTMLCYDNPAGLTNNATLGHSETGGVSQHRRKYKKSFMKFHATLTPDNARLEFPQAQRRFIAPSEILNAGGNVAAMVQAHLAKGLRLRRDIEADVVVITNLAFKGGNTSSTLDEVDWLLAQGLNVKIIHAPTPRDAARSLAERARAYSDLIVNWARVGDVRAHVAIVRHPVAATSAAFRSMADRVTADHAFVVINNSLKLSDGRPAYRLDQLVESVGRMQAGSLEFCPISGVIRDEMRAEADQLGITLPLSRLDWLPTMDAAQYGRPLKPVSAAPFIIGRHARDGAEKWDPNPKALRAAYPDSPDFRVEILGGAGHPRKILGDLPQNWTVHPFGSIAPEDYLPGLDAYVYFPHPDLVEAFGRSIAEAMLAGVPVILPPQFRSTFGDLAFYAAPDQVAPLVRAMAADGAGRAAFLTAVRATCARRHAREGIFWRLAGTRFGAEAGTEADPALQGSLPPEAAAWAQAVRSAVGPA